MKNGVINVYKEEGMTSFRVVSKLRGMLGIKKAGHTGTLDPDAKGVLPVCLGKATKLVELLMDSDKTYIAEMLLGKKTDTQDITGNVIESMPDDEIRKILHIENNNSPDFNYAETKIAEALMSLKGEIMQLPPMYSALKVDGVKLVDAARKGVEIERKERPVTVYDYNDISFNDHDLSVRFTVRCSKGTYVRTICEDAGDILEIPACLKSLERTAASGLDKSTALTLLEIQELKDKGEIENYIIPTDKFLEKYDKLTVKDEFKAKLLVGNYLSKEEVIEDISANGIYRIYDNTGLFYALYKYSKEENILKTEKMFI